MKILTVILPFLSLIFTINALADSGTTYCPKPQDFHYDKSIGSFIGPADWGIYNKPSSLKIESFVEAVAEYLYGQISSCRYKASFKGESVQVDATSFDLPYFADNPSDPVWQEHLFDKRCAGPDPQRCRFHRY